VNSISVRLLLAAALVMAVFIGLTTLAIQHTVNQRAEQARFERMQGQVYGLLGVTGISDNGEIDISNIDLPNALLRQPMSGTYAEIRDTQIEQIWRSPSLTTELPSSSEGEIGQWKFTTEQDSQMGKLFLLRFAVEWLLPDGNIKVLQFVVADSRNEFDQQSNAFNHKLWLAMAGMGALLLTSIALVLAWGLSPLRRISRQLNEIENGRREQLPADVPLELNPVASRMNALIASERGRRQKYRNTLDDLAHSLKTPLSVLRNINSGEANNELQRQADRMQQIVDYHIKRADAGTQRLMTPAIALNTPVQRITRSLEKVFHQQGVRFINNINDGHTVRVEEGDLMEILGNLLENACKYGADEISIDCAVQQTTTVITIKDNGPGFPEQQLDRLTKRGVRADTHQEGQGLGLAICRELIEGYGGELSLQNRVGGGAEIVIVLPASPLMG
jgi:two-component system sensor histidine kinase PhoQ